MTTTTEPDPEQLLPDMQTLQRKDPDISVVSRAKEAAEKPDVDMQKAQSLETRRLLQLWEQLEIRDGILFRRWEKCPSPTGERCYMSCMIECMEVTWERPKC